MAMAAFASNAGASTAPTPESSLRGGSQFNTGEEAA